MTFIPTPEQSAIIDAGLIAQRITACAGSGKTATAVRRMVEIRKRTGASHRYVALLSYSNVAVERFRVEYRMLAKENVGLSERVTIATVDSFIATELLLPHGSRVMGCATRPFLVHGAEPFLSNFKISNGEYGVGIERLAVVFRGQEGLDFQLVPKKGKRQSVPYASAEKMVSRLGKVGAYTYELGRYWALKILMEEEGLLRALARRYPYILIDEAQDVGSMHGVLFAALQEAGSTITLIGDSNQSIYEFADADGTFLRDFKLPENGVNYLLSQNRRSVQPIVELAKKLSGVESFHVRVAPERRHGIFILKYATEEIPSLPAKFSVMLEEHGFAKSEAAILCRGADLLNQLTGGGDQAGRGAAEKFAKAAIYRDRSGDIAEAFAAVLDGVLKILNEPPRGLKNDVLSGSRDELPKNIRRIIWAFIKSSDTGLPESTLSARKEWLPRLRNRLPALLGQLETRCGLKRLDTWARNITTANFGDDSLLPDAALNSPVVPIYTVHKVKGESIGAVLQVAKKTDVANLLAGPSTEEGRIGYVSVTRAADLFILAVPPDVPPKMLAQLQERGFVLW